MSFNDIKDAKTNFLDFSPGDVARQLTLLDHKRFQSLPIREFEKQKALDKLALDNPSPQPAVEDTPPEGQKQ